jgi:hypothetical protein
MLMFTVVLIVASGVARAEENQKDRLEKNLIGAFRQGLKSSKESAVSTNIDIKIYGHTLVLGGCLGDKRETVTLTCMLCTREEALTKARSLGAILGARSLGKEPAELSTPYLETSSRVYLDGIPVAPIGVGHAVEPGSHDVEIHEKGAVRHAEVEFEYGEKVLLVTTNVDDKRRIKLRSAVALSGLGLSAVALGGIFLWLDGQCSSTKLDTHDNCEEQHDLTGLGWGLIAGGVLVEAAVLIWMLWSDNKMSPIEKRAK